jgi:4-diphosphocytidyl-2-C-methyl-D-erythritol kinase
MQHVELARAKVNVALHVLGRRDDGYHLLDSIVAFAGTADRLSLTIAAQSSLAVTGPFATGLPDDDSNLVLKARRLLAGHVNLPHVAAVLEKNLPVAAGLGGGSADAAAMLRGLLALSGAVIDDAALHAIALALGADVPVCLKQKASRMQGIGEKVTLVEQSPAPAIVLVNPGVACSTPQVFGSLALAKGATHRDGLSLSSPRTWRNDLTDAALAVQPVIAEVLTAMADFQQFDVVRMSGSGATCFGLTTSLADAQKAAAQLRARHPRWWVAASDLQ